MLQYYDFTAPANGGAFQVSAPGRFLYYLNGSAGGADNTIVLRAGNTGQSVLLRPGQSIRLSDTDKAVDTWYVSNYAKTLQIIGTVLVGDGEFRDNRISGDVTIIDGGKNRTLAGIAYYGYSSATAGAGNKTHNQLWNPLGSNKNLIVEKIIVSSSVSQYTRVAYSNVPLPVVNNPIPACKKIGGANSVAELRYDITQGLEKGTVLLTMNISANQSLIIECREPIVIPPGFGVMSVATTAATDLLTNFEFFEENI